MSGGRMGRSSCAGFALSPARSRLRWCAMRGLRRRRLWRAARETVTVRAKVQVKVQVQVPVPGATGG